MKSFLKLIISVMHLIGLFTALGGFFVRDDHLALCGIGLAFFTHIVENHTGIEDYKS